MGKPTYLVWADGRKLTLDEIHQLTGLEIGRPAVNTRLRKAKLEGIPVSTLAQQIAVLTEHKRTPAQPGRDDAGDGGIPLSSDKAEAGRLKTIREALLIDEKHKQAVIETRLQRRDVFYLEAITPAWVQMCVSVRESLRGMIPTLVDKILPLTDRNEALDRCEDELSRHLSRLSDFDLTRELNELSGDESWTFTQTD